MAVQGDKADPFQFFAQESDGSHYFLRKKQIDLSIVVEDLRNSPQNRVLPRYVHLFCDILTFSGDTKNGEAVLDLKSLHQDIAYFHIYARSLLNGFSDLRLLRIECNNTEIGFRFFYDKCSPGLALSFGGQEIGLQPIEVLSVQDNHTSALQSTAAVATIATGEAWRKYCDRVSAWAQVAGCEIEFRSALKPIWSPRQVPTLEIDNAKTGRWLSGLLRSLFDSTCSQVMQSITGAEVDELISAYRFILSCSNGSLKQTHLITATRIMLERLRSPLCYPGVESAATYRFDVPPMSADEYEKQLEKSLKVLESLERSNERLKDQKLAVSAATTLIDAIAESSTDVEKDQRLRKEIDTLKQDVGLRYYHLNKAEMEVGDASADFNHAVENWQKLQKIKFYQEIAVQVGVVIGSLAATIYSGGAAAPVTLGVLASAVDTLAKQPDGPDKFKGETFDEIEGDLNKKIKAQAKSNFWGKVFDLVCKVGPKLWAAYEDTSKNVKAAEDIRAGGGFLSSAYGLVAKMSGQELDYLGIMADWKELGVFIEEVFQKYEEDLRGSDAIGKLREYRVAMRRLCIRGQTTLEAQLNLQKATKSYLIKLAHDAERKRRKERIEALKTTIKGNEEVSSSMMALVKPDLVKDTLNIQRDLFLILHRYCASMTYANAWSRFPGVVASSNMNSLEWRDVLRELQNQQDKAWEGRNGSAAFTAVIETKHDSDSFPTGWKDLLVSENKLYFSTSYRLARNQYCLRVKTVSIEFGGLKRNEDFQHNKNQNISCDLVLGPALSDRDESSEIIQYTLPQRLLTFDFKTGVKTRCENGWKSTAPKYNMPALFGPGYILFREDMAKELDLKAVQWCKIEFRGEAITTPIR